MSPVFTEDISWVICSIDEVVGDDLSCDSFSNSVEGQSYVPLVNLGVGSHTTIYYGVIISKNISLLPEGYP